MSQILGVEVDEEGFLVDLKEWNKEIAIEMAKSDEIELTEEHWEVLNFLRDYYEEYQVAPAVRVLTKQIKKTMGKEIGRAHV